VNRCGGALRATGALLLALSIGAPAPLARQEPSVDDVLTRIAPFSRAELAAIHAGTAVVRSLDTRVRQELAHVGVVYVDAPPARFLERFRDIERFERGPGIPQIGRFGDPPQIDDLAGLTLPADDVEALRRCRPSACDVKLSAAAMDRFRNEVAWTSPGASRQANEVARDVILDLLRAYQAKGNEGLGRYDDDGTPLSVAEQFEALLTSGDALPVPVPALITYLGDFPRSRPAPVEEFFYWTVVDFGLKPTIRVNHVVIRPLDRGPSGVSHAIAIKQLYSSHYFHTTLELRFLVEDRRAGRSGFYLVSMTRSRSDGMTGFRGAFLRPVIARRSRNGVRGYLEHLKRQVESPVREKTGSGRAPDRLHTGTPGDVLT
jgi:hypothetical protein